MQHWAKITSQSRGDIERHHPDNMLLSTVLGLTLSVVALSDLVAGDAGSVVTMSSAKVTNNANDYFDPWSVEIHKTKRSSLLSVKLPTKKELPDTMMMKIIIIMDGQDPIEHVSSLCDALNDDTIGKSFVDAGLPKGKFPKECPFGPGNWEVSKWDPPAEKIPPGSDGPIRGSLMIMEEGKEPYVQIDYEGELSHKAPGP